MAKKTVSFSLEEDLLKLIDDVQKEKKLSSRSAALERILLSKQNERDNIRKIIYEILKEEGLNKDISLTNNKKAIDEVEKSSLDIINDSFEHMPE